jgi:F-box-like
MSVGITKLPPELLLEIIRNLDVSGEDLCQLRSVNSTFNTLTTPTIFGSTFVSNDREDAERFRALLNTPHIARHVQSIIYDESTLR